MVIKVINAMKILGFTIRRKQEVTSQKVLEMMISKISSLAKS